MTAFGRPIAEHLSILNSTHYLVRFPQLCASTYFYRLLTPVACKNSTQGCISMFNRVVRFSSSWPWPSLSPHSPIYLCLFHWPRSVIRLELRLRTPFGWSVPCLLMFGPPHLYARLHRITGAGWSWNTIKAAEFTVIRQQGVRWQSLATKQPVSHPLASFLFVMAVNLHTGIWTV